MDSPANYLSIPSVIMEEIFFCQMYCFGGDILSSTIRAPTYRDSYALSIVQPIRLASFLTRESKLGYALCMLQRSDTYSCMIIPGSKLWLNANVKMLKGRLSRRRLYWKRWRWRRGPVVRLRWKVRVQHTVMSPAPRVSAWIDAFSLCASGRASVASCHCICPGSVHARTATTAYTS